MQVKGVWVMTRIVIVGLYYKSKIVGFNPG
jgi:hypothetical protein